MSGIFRRVRGRSPSPPDTAQDSARLDRESRAMAQNFARGQASEHAARSQAAENEARRQISDAETRRQAAENETRRQRSDAEARRKAAEEARNRSVDAPHDGGSTN